MLAFKTLLIAEVQSIFPVNIYIHGSVPCKACSVGLSISVTTVELLVFDGGVIAFAGHWRALKARQWPDNDADHCGFASRTAWKRETDNANVVWQSA
jgi:hypothetical protein